MNERVRRYVDGLFSDIPDSRRLRELKEEVCVNLSERMADSVAAGRSEEQAFKEAIAELGDVTELADSLRQAARVRSQENPPRAVPLDRTHVFGYVLASAIILFGLVTAGIVHLQLMRPFVSIGTLLPFLVVSAAMFVFLGLTKETRRHYGMNPKRALLYSAGAGSLLFGVSVAAILYFMDHPLWEALAVFIPFVLPALVLGLFLGLTERRRSKIDEAWAREWMEKWNAEWAYSQNPRLMMIRGGVSGALWLFSFAIFLLVGLRGGWRYSWIVFIFACGIEALIEAVLAFQRRS